MGTNDNLEVTGVYFYHMDAFGEHELVEPLDEFEIMDEEYT